MYNDVQNYYFLSSENIPLGGDIDLQAGIQNAQLAFIGLPEDMKKRLLVFVGGYVLTFIIYAY